MNRKINQNCCEVIVPQLLDPTSIQKLKNSIRCALSDEAIDIIYLIGVDKSVFCRGMSLDFVTNITKQNHNIESCIDDFRQLMLFIHYSNKPIIAIIHGEVIAGGVGLAAACDFIIADEKSTFCLTEGLYGLVPAIIASFLLQRINLQAIKSLVFTARHLNSKQALELGLIDILAPDEKNLNRHLKNLTKELLRINSDTIVKTKNLLSEIQNLNCSQATKIGSDLLKTDLKNPKYINNIINYTNYGILPERKAK